MIIKYNILLIIDDYSSIMTRMIVYSAEIGANDELDQGKA